MADNITDPGSVFCSGHHVAPPLSVYNCFGAYDNTVWRQHSKRLSLYQISQMLQTRRCRHQVREADIHARRGCPRLYSKESSHDPCLVLLPREFACPVPCFDVCSVRWCAQHFYVHLQSRSLGHTALGRFRLVGLRAKNRRLFQLDGSVMKLIFSGFENRYQRVVP